DAGGHRGHHQRHSGHDGQDQGPVTAQPAHLRQIPAAMGGRLRPPGPGLDRPEGRPGAEHQLEGDQQARDRMRGDHRGGGQSQHEGDAGRGQEHHSHDGPGSVGVEDPPLTAPGAVRAHESASLRGPLSWSGAYRGGAQAQPTAVTNRPPKTPNSTPQAMMEIPIQTYTVPLRAPRATRVGAVIWEATTSGPSRQTPGTPYRWR